MRALVFDGGALRVERGHPPPAARPGWVRIRVRRAGICRTDLELTRGYLGFRGVLGHEFVGEIDTGAEQTAGQRVVGEINAACGNCETCRRGLGRHCPARTVLGIRGLDGCMAEVCTLPATNLHPVPAQLSDEQAVFIEPLAAAHEILDQVDVAACERAVVLGDGKLGILCAWVLAAAGPAVTLVGRHPEKLARAAWGGVRTAVAGGEGDAAPASAGADIVVEATGSGAGLAAAVALCRPRGTLVLKSTVADYGRLDLAPIVVHEITVVGSRCGRFPTALAGLSRHRFPVERLIDATYPLAQGPAAFAHAARRGTLKVLLAPSWTEPEGGPPPPPVAAIPLPHRVGFKTRPLQSSR